MKRKTVLIFISVLALVLTGCGESLMLEDATEAVSDSSSSQADESIKNTPGQTSAGAAAIMGQVSQPANEENESSDNTSVTDYTGDFVMSSNKDITDLMPYELLAVDPDRDDETDTIQLRINEDSRDHTISSLRFWVDGTINDVVCDLSEYDTFRGAYVCDLNFTDSQSNIITVFTSSRTGRHQTTFYSLRNDKVTLIDSFGGFIDFLSIDGAGDFSITEATDIRTSEYGVMYLKKNLQTDEVYSYETRDSEQLLTIASNSVGYYPEEGHFAYGYPFSLKKELTMYVNGEENYMTGTLPVNFRGVITEAHFDEGQDDPTVFLVKPEDGWTKSETNIDSPIYAPSSAGSEDFDPDDYTGWISFSELSEVSNEGFYVETQQ